MKNFFKDLSKSIANGHIHFLGASIAIMTMFYLVEFSVLSYNVMFDSSFGKFILAEFISIASSSNFMAYTMLFVVFVFYATVLFVPIALSIYFGNWCVSCVEKIYENSESIDKFENLKNNTLT